MKRVLIVPIGKPRMVKSDAWRGRKCVQAYWEFKDRLRAELGSWQPDGLLMVDFFLPTPASWAKRRKIEHEATYHYGKPDLDNLVKAVMDCLLEHDEGIHDIRARKFYSAIPQIIFYDKLEDMPEAY